MTDTELSCKGIIDSHAHYFDRRFESETEAGADALLENTVFPSGIEAVINVGTSPENSLVCIAQAARHEKMYAAIGIHPEDAMYLEGSPEENIDKIKKLLDTKEKRAAQKIVALGEIGLDYHCDNCDKAKQARYFELQLSLAQELDIPVIIHDREAHGDTLDTVLKYPKVKGVFHSFSGSAEMARELTRKGFYISFSGVLTFKNARKAREVAASVDRNRILIETDSPYLAPEPYRGRINSSAYMCHTARTLSEIWGLDFAETVALTAANTKRLFSL